MNALTKKRYTQIALLLLCFILNLNSSFSQDFYINNKSEVVYINHVIPTQWKNLNLNESSEFLSNSGFSNIKKTLNGDKEVVAGFISNDEYKYMRRLVFEDKIILEYSDAIVFSQPCLLCLANDVKAKFSNNPQMLSIYEKSYQSALKQDATLKDLFYKNHIQSMASDGISSPLSGDLNDFGFRFTNSVENENYSIVRNSNLQLENGKIYNFYSERRVILKEQDYTVGEFNLKNINQYDLNLMIDIFLLDCKNNNIPVRRDKVVASFETLEGSLIGLSNGINNDSRIDLKIDPKKWENSSIPKRWYLIYHELGHDVLNLNHGNGGKMMFNFADKGYSWEEFWNDRKYMFDSYKRK
jgi:hypothetical protein